MVFAIQTIMWLGAGNYAWLRYSAFYLVFIWISSLFLAEVVNRRDVDLPPRDEVPLDGRVHEAVVRAGASGARVAWRPNLLQACDVLREIVDVGIRQRLRDARHVAGIIGAAVGPEVVQLLQEVFRNLPGELRVGRDHAVAVGHVASDAHLARNLFALRDIDLRGILCERLSGARQQGDAGGNRQNSIHAVTPLDTDGSPQFYYNSRFCRHP